MLCMEITVVYCKIHVAHVNILCGKKCRGFLMLNLAVQRITTEH
jgi:hypothetical protein